jgi:hypothetical protein
MVINCEGNNNDHKIKKRAISTNQEPSPAPEQRWPTPQTQFGSQERSVSNCWLDVNDPWTTATRGQVKGVEGEGRVGKEGETEERRGSKHDGKVVRNKNIQYKLFYLLLLDFLAFMKIHLDYQGLHKCKSMLVTFTNKILCM